MALTHPPVYLKKNAGRRLHTGHLWVYSNEIDNARSPLKHFEPGQLITLYSSQEQILGSGYINPHSLITVRLISREPTGLLDEAWLKQQINRALLRRQRLFAQPYYRLIYGEGDGLPGLVVDRFGDFLVVQITTAGMERVRTEILNALESIFSPQAIVLRNDSPIRTLEGLTNYIEVALGSLNTLVRLEENGALFEIPVLAGQKTGWFYDHRFNRARLNRYVKQQRVLDVFSYTGAWGIQAAKAGAQAVWCLDSSQTALEGVIHNAKLNQVDNRITTLAGDAFTLLKTLRQQQEKFDVIILDPPAFIKRQKDKIKGEQAYRRLNQQALSILKENGVLISASCSLHLSRDTFLELIQAASFKTKMPLQLLEQGHQSPDHPIHPAISETDYLKAFIFHAI